MTFVTHRRTSPGASRIPGNRVGVAGLNRIHLDVAVTDAGSGGADEAVANERGQPYPTRTVSRRVPAPATRRLGFRSLLVYTAHMTRTNIDIDDEACTEVMRRYRLSTKREAVNFALRTVAAEPLGLDEARGLRGSGWDGDLDEMRSGRAR